MPSAMGVDELYILSDSWHESDGNSSTLARAIAMLNDAGVAITLTSFAAAISFAIGAWLCMTGRDRHAR